MSDSTSTLQLVVNSDGVRAANERLKSLSDASAAAERAAQRLAAAVEESAKQQAAAAARAAATAEQAEARKAEAAQKTAQRRAEMDRKTADRQAAAEQRALDRVKAQLRSEEERIEHSEQARRQIILANTKVTEDERARLLAASASKAAGQRQEQTFLGKVGEGFREAFPIAAGLGVAMAVAKIAEEFKHVAHEVIQVTIEHEKLQASLTGVTGSTDEAKIAFEGLASIAAKMPFSTSEVTKAFLTLANAGLNTSANALKAYANIAAQTGHSLDDVVHAIQAASMGSVRAMREFGVRMAAEGANVNISFRGVTTTIHNDSRSIQDALIKIGQTQFAGAVERQMDTMGGSIAKLEKDWHHMIVAISESAIGDAAKDGLRILVTWVEKLEEALTSDTMNEAVETFERTVMRIGVAIDKSIAFVTGDKNRAQMADEAMRVFELQMQNDRGWRETEREQRAKEKSEAQGKLAGYSENRPTSLGKKEKTKGSSSNFDIMAQIDSANASELKEQLNQYLAVVESVMTEKEKKENEFARRRNVIMEYAPEDDRAGLIEKLNAQEKAYADSLAKQEKAAEDARNKKKEDLLADLQSEEEAIRAAEQKKVDAAKEAQDEGLIDARQFAMLKAKYEADANKQIEEKNRQLVESSLQNTEAMFGNLATAAKNMGGEQSGVYKTMFAAQKAFAVASATMSMATGIGKAVGLGWPDGIPAAIAAAAEGAKVLAMISSTNFSGAYDAGGDIPFGKVGLVGERGPEFVRGPASVTSRMDTARMLQGGSGGGAGGGVGPVSFNPNLILVTDPHASVHSYLSSTRGQQTLVKAFKDNHRVLRAATGVK